MANYEGIFASEGLVLSGAGAERHAHCPFHEDKQPSLSVNVETGLWRCHACGAQGDAYTFYEKRHHCDFKRAKQAVDRFLGIATPSKPQGKKRAASEPPPIPEEEVDQLHQAFLESEKPLNWLKSARGISEETIRAYKIGYDGARITIPVRDEQGQVRNLRRYHPTKRPKMLPYAEGYGVVRLFPIEALESNELVICEGELDCLISRQHGIPAITQTGGAGTWKEEWAPLFRGKKVWICYDHDTAGAKGAEQVAQALAPVAAEVRIVDLPVEETGEDLTDWFLRYGGTLERWQELAEAAEPYQPPAPERELTIEELVESLPPDVEFQEKQKALKEIYRRIARINSPTQRDHYIRLVKDRFKLSMSVVREEVRLAETALKTEPSMPTPLTAPREHGWTTVQDLRGDVFHYGIWLPTSTGEWVLRLVTSDHRLEDPPQVPGDRLPKDTARWSVDSTTPYNVFAYLAGKAEVDPAALFHDLQMSFRHIMWYPDDRTYYLLAAWVMQSYVFMIFDQVGYLALVGTKRSGKTRLFELLEMLAFNARISSSISDSYIFRTVELDRTTLLVDEADSLRQPIKDGTNERLEILRSGYRRSGSVGRIEGEDRRRVDFSTYSMKAIANVTGIEEALEDRTIAIPVERKPKGVHLERVVERNLRQTTQILRNRLYCFGLQYASQLAQMYETVEVPGVEDREAEIWSGLLCIADLVGGSVREKLEELAREGQERKALHEGSESIDAQIIMAIWSVVKETEPVRVDKLGRWYSSKVIRQAIMDQLEWDNFSYQRLANDLIKLRIINDSTSYKQRLRLEYEVTDEKGVSRTKKQQVMCYRLDEERVIAAAERYSIPLTGTVPEENDDDDEAPF